MGHGRVLVVDDEADMRKSLRLTLTKAGYEVIEAEDGGKAIEAVRSGDNPLMLDTIIMDLVMPKVNGVEATAYIRSQFRGVPILVLTGHPNIQNMNALYKQGIVDISLNRSYRTSLWRRSKKQLRSGHLKVCKTNHSYLTSLYKQSKKQLISGNFSTIGSACEHAPVPRLGSGRDNSPIFREEEDRGGSVRTLSLSSVAPQ